MWPLAVDRSRVVWPQLSNVNVTVQVTMSGSMANVHVTLRLYALAMAKLSASNGADIRMAQLPNKPFHSPEMFGHNINYFLK